MNITDIRFKTLKSFLNLCCRHWIAVFGDVVGRKLQSTLKELIKLLDPEKGLC